MKMSSEKAMATNLRTRLEAIHEKFEASASAEVRGVMHRATEELRVSGAAERALGEGARVPAFELPNQAGIPIRSEALLARGPLVLTFFRGKW